MSDEEMKEERLFYLKRKVSFKAFLPQLQKNTTIISLLSKSVPSGPLSSDLHTLCCKNYHKYINEKFT